MENITRVVHCVVRSQKKLSPFQTTTVFMKKSRLTLDVWGPAAWQTLHSFAHALPETLDDTEQYEVKQFLHSFATFLPCSRCGKHFSEFLHQNERTRDCFATRHNIVSLLNDCHNDVNRRRGKRQYTLDEHYGIYHGEGNRGARDVQRIALLLTVSLLGLFSIRVYKKNLADKQSNQT